MKHDQPGLEVDGGDLPEVDLRQQAPLYTTISEHADNASAQKNAEDEDHFDEPVRVNSNERGRMCGMSRGHFWIITAIVMMTVVIVAVGGGVGGALAGKANGNGG